MEFSEYVKRLKKVSVNDIKEIIDESLKENDDVSFGFREQRGFIFFGKLHYGLISRPYLVCGNVDNLCNELYELLEREYKCSFHFEHSFDGSYDYYGTVAKGVDICFPNLNFVHQSWILNQIYIVDVQKGK